MFTENCMCKKTEKQKNTSSKIQLQNYREAKLIPLNIQIYDCSLSLLDAGTSITRGSVGWACVAHLSFCFEET